MATNMLSMVVFIGLLGALSACVSATDFVVGDEYGWTLDFDYQAWAKGKKFLVGDRLIFKYPVGQHNVFKVDGYSFQQCIKPPANWSLASGYDVVTLASPGRKWYICGVGKHCEARGMKLVIDVLPQFLVPAPHAAPITPAPIPSLPFGKVFMVGDDSGWTLNFDYRAWAMGKEFHVGDILVFKCPAGAHNVYKVNGTDFQQCTIPVYGAPLASGYDMVMLTTPGKKWYICGVNTHCKTGGMKLVIDVVPPPMVSPPLSPSYNGARRLGNN